MLRTSCSDESYVIYKASVDKASTLNGSKNSRSKDAKKSGRLRRCFYDSSPSFKFVLTVIVLSFCLLFGYAFAESVAETKFQEIEVQWGDSVSEIAEHYGISQAELVRLNNLTSTRIMLGQKIRVPVMDLEMLEARAKASAESLLTEQSDYDYLPLVVVQENDSLSSIAATYGMSLSDIRSLNNLSSARVEVGQYLIVNRNLLQIDDVELITVAQGQKLSDIAASRNVSLRSLMDLNNLSSPRLVEGQKLIVADTSALVSVESEGNTVPGLSVAANEATGLFLQSELETVIVQPKDTLDAIAAEFGQSVEHVMALNHLASIDLQVGDVLFVNPNRSLEVDGELQYFTVRRGDSLDAIAKRYDTTVNALMRVNNLSGHRIFAGDRLRLPYNVNGDLIASVTEEEMPETYTVRSGDTLYNIAYAYGMSIDTLIAFNNLYGSTIHPGQTLYLAATDKVPAPEPLIYAVRKGDTLSSIASRYGVSIDEIASFNSISPTGILSIGYNLNIPEHYARELLASSSQADQGASAVATYTVQKGDTLIAIAQRYRTSVDSIAAGNRIRGSYIRAGQVLQVPSANDVLAATSSFQQRSSDSKISWPIRGTITSNFGWRSLVVNGKNLRNHTGMDIDGHTGDFIHSAVGGKVTFSGWQGGYGNLVVVTNGNMETYYAHASELLVQTGETVVEGQRIARVGASGMATGSHLHFEVRINGVAQDPAFFLD